MKVVLGTIHKAARTAKRTIGAWANRTTEREAVSLARSLKPARILIDPDQGYARFSSAQLGFEKSVLRLAALAREWKVAPERAASDKPFLINLLRSDDLFDYPEILDLAMHDELLGAATTYLGQVPWLVMLNVWWTPPNQTAMRSQLYHYDHRDARQPKIFINLCDVGADSGPLHFLPARSSLSVDRAVGYSHRRYTDEEVHGACSRQEVISTVGPTGAGFAVDTGRCLHYGSRGNRADRLVLMVSYARANCVDKGGGCDILDPVRERLVSQRYSADRARSFSLLTR